MALAGDANESERMVVYFPRWKECLAAATLPASVRASHEREIFQFFRHCRDLHVSASIIVAKQYLGSASTPSSNPGFARRSASAREALRWFFRAARNSSV